MTEKGGNVSLTVLLVKGVEGPVQVVASLLGHVVGEEEDTSLDPHTKLLAELPGHVEVHFLCLLGSQRSLLFIFTCLHIFNI